MKRRAFYSVLGAGCMGALVPGQTLSARDRPKPIVFDPKYQEHIDWAKHLLESNQPSRSDYKRFVHEYLQPYTALDCKNCREGITIKYCNQYGTMVEIQIVDGSRKLSIKNQ